MLPSMIIVGWSVQFTLTTKYHAVYHVMLHNSVFYWGTVNMYSLRFTVPVKRYQESNTSPNTPNTSNRYSNKVLLLSYTTMLHITRLSKLYRPTRKETLISVLLTLSWSCKGLVSNVHVLLIIPVEKCSLREHEKGKYVS